MGNIKKYWGKKERGKNKGAKDDGDVEFDQKREISICFSIG